MATINGGTLIIALPELARELRAPLFSLVWVILGYMLAQTALVLMVGRFADMVGRKKLIGTRGYYHLTTGFLLTRLAGSVFVFAPLAGRLADRLPARIVSSVGMLATAGGLLGMATIGVRTPYWE